jgi:hypothetical protein
MSAPSSCCSDGDWPHGPSARRWFRGRCGDTHEPRIRLSGATDKHRLLPSAVPSRPGSASLELRGTQDASALRVPSWNALLGLERRRMRAGLSRPVRGVQSHRQSRRKGPCSESRTAVARAPAAAAPDFSRSSRKRWASERPTSGGMTVTGKPSLLTLAACPRPDNQSHTSSQFMPQRQ